MGAAGVVILSLAGMWQWALLNPFAVNWDNAIYLNDCRRDLRGLRSGGLGGLGLSFLYTNPWRPPAYRLLSLAATPLFGADMTTLRAASLLFWAAALAFVHAGVKAVAGEAPGWLAVMLLAASPLLTGAVRV